MNSNIPSKEENKRLDDLTAYNSTLLNHLHGERLTAVMRAVARRGACSDSAYREALLSGTHPDDLYECLALAGVTLASLGIASLKPGA